MSRLQICSGYIQQVAEVISEVVKLDVTIVDNNYIRVAGTGNYKKLIGNWVPSGSVFSHINMVGKKAVIFNPKEDYICLNCSIKDKCLEVANVTCPIIGPNEILGFISFAAFDQEQKQRLVNAEAYHADFITKMAELIGSKVAEEEVKMNLERSVSKFQAIINSVHEGIIVLDVEGKITDCNNSIQTSLRVAKDDLLKKPICFLFPELAQKNWQKEIKITDIKLTLNKAFGFHQFLCSLEPIYLNSKIIGTVITLRDYQEVKKMVARISGNTEKVYEKIIYKSAVMERLLNKVTRAAQTKSTVLIRGESGTGKELIARAIHELGARAKNPFVAINCGAIPENLLESELFGYEEGSFTGASKGGKLGKIEMANNGTLFLDEIGDMSLNLQIKLLRFLQEGTLERLGGRKEISVNVRVIAATHRNLEEMVRKDLFRHDLYYRLNVIPLFVPPLRERQEDIELLLYHFLGIYNKELNKHISGFAPEVIKTLTQYSWPGNVRELQNVVEYAMNMTQENHITMDCLPLFNHKGFKVITNEHPLLPLDHIIENTLKQALNRFGKSEEGINQVANALGISRATVYRKLKKYKI